MAVRARRSVLTATTVVGAAAVALGVAPRARAVAPVPREMRSPVLWVPFGLLTTRPGLRLLRRLPERPGSVAAGVGVEAREVPAGDGRPAVPVFVYESTGRARPSGALVWLHGGGYVLGSASAEHPVASGYARDLGALVVSVEYRLAPEHPFPAGLDDAYAALSWLHGHADALGVDRSRIAVAGESAGGGLAAALAQRALDRGEVPVAFQLLVYPMLDDRTVLDRPLRRALVWSPASNRRGWTAYLGHPPRPAEDRPHAVPARREDLTGLAPAWVGVGDLDLFHAEDLAYAERLRAAGVPCELEVVPGLYHGAHGLAPEHSPTAAAFRDSATRSLGTALGRT